MTGPAAVLARVTGLPVRLWLAAANPELTDRVRRLEESAAIGRERAAALAGRIGEQVVPRDALGRPDRALALRVRRLLHNGRYPAPTEMAALARAARRVGAPDELVRGLWDLADYGAQLTDTERAVEAALAAELARLPHTVWELTGDATTIAGRALRHGNPQIHRDIAGRVAGGEPWTTKRMRRRSDYLWSMVARGTTKPVPRGWLGHVAIVPVAEVAAAGPIAAGTPGLALSCDVSACATENVHHLRARLGSDPSLWTDPSTVVALAPLRRADSERLHVWTYTRPDAQSDDSERADAERRTADGAPGPALFREVTVRRTPAIDALLAAVGGRTVPIGEAVRCLMPIAGTSDVAVAFIRHLAHSGLLVVSGAPEVRLSGGDAASAGPPDSPDSYDAVEATKTTMDRDAGRDAAQWFLDARRDVRTPIGADWYQRVGELVAQAGRIAALIRADARPDTTVAASADEPPRPLLDVVLARLARPVDPVAHQPHVHGWSRPRAARSAYAALFDRLRAAPAARPVDITPVLLDELGAPAARWDWPVDVLVRPMWPVGEPAETLGVLGHGTPAGMLDARFADVLSGPDGEPPWVDAYRDLLRHIEEQTGGLFVELLLPPVSPIAANAIRRPVYTNAWTGDPDPWLYHGAPPPDRRYIPLAEITVRRTGGGVVAEAGGQPVWPMYHATRTPRPPWDTLYQALMAASPQPPNWPACLTAPSALLTGRRATPRITLGGALVLTPAAWRVERGELWDFAAPVLAKVRALQRMADRLDLPRWLFVDGAPDGKLACDLASVRAVDVIERVVDAAPDGAVVLEEMLPSPDHFPVVDDRTPVPDRYAAELLVRLPAGEPPARLVRRLAGYLASRLVDGMAREPRLASGHQAPGDPANAVRR